MTATESPGGGRVLGHDLEGFVDVPSGVEARCECGETFWGRWKTAAAKAWAIHSTEEAQRRARPVEMDERWPE